MSRDTNKEIEKELHDLLYNITYSEDVPTEDGLTTSIDTFDMEVLQKELKKFMNEKLEVQRKRTLEEVENELLKVARGNRVLLEGCDLINVYKEGNTTEFDIRDTVSKLKYKR